MVALRFLGRQLVVLTKNLRRGSSQGQQCSGSVEIVSKETALGLRRRGLARRLMHEKEKNVTPRTENRINYILKTNLPT